MLSLHEPGYLHALQRFRQALRQRNSMLRQGAPATLLEAWTEPLLTPATRVMAARAQWVSAYAARFAERYAAISGGLRAERARESERARVKRESDERAKRRATDVQRVWRALVDGEADPRRGHVLTLS